MKVYNIEDNRVRKESDLRISDWTLSITMSNTDQARWDVHIMYLRNETDNLASLKNPTKL